MIKFAHTADIHFGVENYGKIDSETGIHTRLLDFYKSLNFCIDYTINNKLDFFLFAGDAYKTASPSPTQQKLLLSCFLRLYKHNIPVVITVGNHDNPLSFGKANSLDLFDSLPVNGFHVISKPKSFVLETKSGPVQIVGIPWPTRNTISISNKYIYNSAQKITEHISKSVSKIISNFASKLNPELPAVLTGHLTVSSGIFSGSEKRAIYGTDPVLLPSELSIKPFDYIALGHLHRYQDLNNNNYPPVVYAGSIERVDFGERKEAKGFCEVNLVSKSKTDHKFIETPARPMIQLDIKLSDDPDLDQTKQIIDKVKSINIKNSILKIKYYLPENIKSNINLRSITRACEDAIYLVAVMPIQNITNRATRTNMNSDMNISQLLKNYFNTKKISPKKQLELINKTLELQDNLENS